MGNICGSENDERSQAREPVTATAASPPPPADDSSPPAVLAPPPPAVANKPKAKKALAKRATGKKVMKKKLNYAAAVASAAAADDEATQEDKNTDNNKAAEGEDDDANAPKNKTNKPEPAKAAATKQQEGDDEEEEEDEYETFEPETTDGGDGDAKEEAPWNDNAKYETVRCHHVYDGDTLTLMDSRRVRFLGVDAPEVKQKEAFSQESKRLVKQLCDRKELELEIDTREPEDKYGRVLARVWVWGDDNVQVCVNDLLLEAGLANFYQPKNSELFARDWMLSRQKKAREEKKGQWAEFEDVAVYTTKNGGSYHRKDCEHVKEFHLKERQKSECLDEGLSGCRTCDA